MREETGHRESERRLLNRGRRFLGVSVMWSHLLHRRLIVLFGLAVAVNYPWERAQSSLYLTKDGTAIPWWHCMLASLGDGLLILLIFWAGSVVFGQRAWFEHPGFRGYLLMAVTGLVLIIPLEWLMISRMEWWSYTAQMPLMPGIAVGVSPVVQMLVLPPLIFTLLAWWHRKMIGREPCDG